MSNLNKKFKQILDDIEQNIKDKDDLEYIKVQIFNLYNLFFDEISKIEGTINKKMSMVENMQANLEDRVEILQSKLSNMENDLYVDEEEDSDFSIVCPYCNNEFIVEFDELKDEVKCPECNNIIELDWGENDCEDDCGHNCSQCNHDDEDDM